MISSIQDRIVDFLIDNRKRNAILLLIFLFSFSLFAARIRPENSIESFISPKDPDIVFYQDFKKVFGDDQFLLLVIPVGEMFTKDTLAKIDSLSESLEGIKEIRKVRSITTIEDIVGTEDSFEVKEFIEDIPNDQASLDTLKHIAVNKTLYQIDLLSLDAKIASIIIEPKNTEDTDRYKTIFKKVKEVVNQSDFKESVHYIAGDPLLELQMVEDMWHDLALFMPITFIFLIGMIYFCMRSVRTVVVVIALINCCLAFLLGIMGLFQIKLNAITVGLPTLILCIAVLDALHILNIYRVHLDKKIDSQKAFWLSLRENITPCFLTSVTTCIGFMCVSLSSIVPIKQFGLLAGGAVLAAFPICFILSPWLFLWIKPKDLAWKPTEQNFFSKFFSAFASIFSRKRLSIAVTCMIFIIAAVGISTIYSETMFINFMNKKSDIWKATDYIGSNLGGVTPLEISIDTHEPDGVKNPEVLREIEKLQAFIVALPGIDKTVSPVDFIKEMHEAINNEDHNYYKLPDSRNLIAQYILLYSFSGRNNDMDDFLDYPYQKARIRIRVNDQSSEDLANTIEAIDRYIQSDIDPTLDVKLTSYSIIQYKMMSLLIRGQIGGVLIGILLLSLIICFANRSFVVGLYSLVPNLLPIFVGMGIMGFLGISLNAGTAMISCIAFGLIVDDTIYFIHHAKEALKSEANTQTAVKHILHKIGPSIFYTSIFLSTTFAIMMFSDSFFTFSFGMLCAITIMLALLADILIMPAFVLHSATFRNALKR